MWKKIDEFISVQLLFQFAMIRGCNIWGQWWQCVWCQEYRWSTDSPPHQSQASKCSETYCAFSNFGMCSLLCQMWKMRHLQPPGGFSWTLGEQTTGDQRATTKPRTINITIASGQHIVAFNINTHLWQCKSLKSNGATTRPRTLDVSIAKSTLWQSKDKLSGKDWGSCSTAGWTSKHYSSVRPLLDGENVSWI